MRPRCSLRRGRRLGFTLIELVAVLSVLAILSALTLSGIQAARNASRKALCSNNLRQIGVALASYHSQHGSLPPGRIKAYDPRLLRPNAPCFPGVVDKSFLFMILPHVEQDALYNMANQNLSIFSQENRTSHSVAVSAFVCPADSGAGTPRPMDESLLVPLGFAEPEERLTASVSSYVANYGSLFVSALSTPLSGCRVDGRLLRQADGVVSDFSPIPYAAIGDGLSNTVLASERSTQLLKGPGDPFAMYGWYFSGNWGDTLFTSMYPINARGRDAASSSFSALFSASSNHGAGANVLMCDGSVRFIEDNIDSWDFDHVNERPEGAEKHPSGWWLDLPPRGIWQALCTRAGREITAAE